MRAAAGVGILLFVLAACGESRPIARVGGDADGGPVTVTAIYDREALAALAHGAGFTRTVVIERDAWADPFGPHHLHHFHHHPSHAWPGRAHAYEPMTVLTLLIGDGPAEGQLLRARLMPGSATWTVPMRAGRTAVVSLQASGGREGWREIGRFSAAPGMTATVHLEGAQPRLETSVPVIPSGSAPPSGP